MQHATVKITKSVATILIERPGRLGALDPILMSDLQTALGDIHQENKVRSVILAGGGPYFCSGLDLVTMDRIRQMPPADAVGQWFTLWRNLTQLYETVLRFPKPIIAAVDGPAYGAGFGLALAADIIVASRKAVFAASAVNLGLVGGATAALLNFRLGASRAARFALTGDEMDADAAFQIGLCESPVPSEQVWVAASEIGTRIASGSPQAVAATRRLLNETIGETLLSQLHAAAADAAAICTTESAAEGIASFFDSSPSHS